MTLTEKIEAYLGELREAFVSGAMWRQSEEVSEYHEARDYSDKWHAEALRRYPDKPKEEEDFKGGKGPWKSGVGNNPTAAKEGSDE